MAVAGDARQPLFRVREGQAGVIVPDESGFFRTNAIFLETFKPAQFEGSEDRKVS